MSEPEITAAFDRQPVVLVPAAEGSTALWVPLDDHSGAVCHAAIAAWDSRKGIPIWDVGSVVRQAKLLGLDVLFRSE